MGTTLRRRLRIWLGIEANDTRLAVLKRQIDEARERIENLESDVTAQKDHQNQLTSESTKPKIVPKRQNWRQFRSSVERATEEEA